nr:hypothetical protein [Desulfovibrio sp.]
MAAFLGDSLRRFFAPGALKIQCRLLRLHFLVFLSTGQLTVFQNRVQRIFLTFPALFMLDERQDFVSLFNVKTLMRLHNFFRFGVHAVDGNMEMIIVGIVVQSEHGLMPDQTHSFQKNVHDFLNLFPGRLLPLLPRKYPVRHRHFAVNGLPGEGNHFHFLPGMCSGKKIPPARIFDFFLRVFVVRVANVVHQVAYLPCFRLGGFFVFDFLNDHASPR